jgi:hypothetical protein
MLHRSRHRRVQAQITGARYRRREPTGLLGALQMSSTNRLRISDMRLATCPLCAADHARAAAENCGQDLLLIVPPLGVNKGSSRPERACMSSGCAHRSRDSPDLRTRVSAIRSCWSAHGIATTSAAVSRTTRENRSRSTSARSRNERPRSLHAQPPRVLVPEPRWGDLRARRDRAQLGQLLRRERAIERDELVALVLAHRFASASSQITGLDRREVEMDSLIVAGPRAARGCACTPARPTSWRPLRKLAPSLEQGVVGDGCRAWRSHRRRLADPPERLRGSLRGSIGVSPSGVSRRPPGVRHGTRDEAREVCRVGDGDVCHYL